MIALVGGRADRAVEVEFLVRALARETAQPAQGDADVARPQFLVAGKILEFAAVPDLDGAASPAAVLADAHALGMVAVGAERRGSRRADPFRAALMAALLFGEALAQRLHQFVETELVDLVALLRR